MPAGDWTGGSGYAAMTVLQASIVDEELYTEVTGEEGPRGIRDIVSDSLIIPILGALLSFIVLIVHATWRRYGNTKRVKHPNEPNEARVFDKGVIQNVGGPVIFAFRTVRLLACFALCSMETWAIFSYWAETDWTMKTLEWGQIGSYAYATVLAALSIALSPGQATVVIRHLSFVMGLTWLTFVARDVLPLATYTMSPVDGDLGAPLWIYIGIMTVPAVIVPLLVPRTYIPYDPKHPSEEQHPEQTASILSRLIYTYLDPLILKANRVSHLDLDQLPPVPDYDQANNMISRNLSIVNTYLKKNRHVFFGLISAFSHEYIIMFFTTLLKVTTSFASPIGLNRLLKLIFSIADTYIETDGKDAVVRPWVWILWLLVGPLFEAIAENYHTFLNNAISVRSGATITQLVFDHALRVRVKAETESGPVAKGDTTAVPTPENASTSEQAETTTEEDTSPGKQQEPSVSEASTKVADEPDTKGGNFVGRLNNLITSDLGQITQDPDIYVLVLYLPIRLASCIAFLYYILGWSSFVGLAATVMMFPLPGYLGSLLAGTQAARMKKTDVRVQAVTETMNIIRMIKLFGWESKMGDRIAKTREDELSLIRRLKFLKNFIFMTNFALPFVTSIATYGAYSILMRKELTASVVFSSMVVFDMFRSQLWIVSSKIPSAISAKVSLDRLNVFLRETELLDEYDPEFQSPHNNPAVGQHVIGFRNASFTWDNGSDGSSTPRRSFTLRIENELLFKRGHINLVIGPTGSGKTSLLMALLGEMHYIPLGPDSYFYLPRDEGIAYASQESWVQSETIRDNILFGSEYEEERYNKVIEQCGLKRDLELFEAGEQTEVGERGLTLSGGQKARVTLARAVYSSASILILDDVLAALDVHTAKWIVEKCFKGELIRGRTVILVTHNIALTSPVAEFVVALGKNGTISSQGDLPKVLAKDGLLSAEFENEEKELAKAEDTVDGVEPQESKQVDGKLVMAEEIAVGRVGWPAIKLFLGSLGGKHWVIWWGAFALNNTITPVMETFETWYLGYWAHQYEERPPSEVSASYYLTVYSILVLISCSVNLLGYLYYVFGAIRASRVIHQKLIASVLGSTMRWLDTTPTSRIISRCTQDLAAVDDNLPMFFSQVSEVTAFLIARFIALLIIAPSALVPGVLVAVAGTMVGYVYLQAQRSIKREMSNAQAPIISHFGAAMTGLVSIRAYGAQTAVKLESFKRIDRSIRTGRTFRDINRWMAIRMETVTIAFVTGVAIYLFYGRDVSASNTGFALNMAIGFCGLVKFWIFAANYVEIQANSLERVQQYLEIEHEPKPTSQGVPPAYWPSSGKLSVEGLSARYSADGPKVLHDVSFVINSGERIGIVGRTGSGKSSLTLALLRCILTDGRVFLDGLPTDAMNLDALRSNVTIIPQVPELLSGTLRQNLDPFEEYEDAVLNDALRAAGLFSLQIHEDEARLTLDTPIASGGNNLSVGQRQILALARAIVRRSKLLILDEATSAIDNETDDIIQASLRNELDKDVTLLTVAHRLQTIMDADKIMVLDAGRIAEFGKPNELLKNERGVLRALVDESGDRVHLITMAGL
ncbi:hypothetical protein EIP91_011586 [Steccherinum ochraceum]|uniref:P-loop containing nucleoside triphosphate hydrolase protein n=1 Tax=Steccherinum ochraceum TaxID=92696 RepID=A0A4R0RLK0_9APHY|nr:hypothetical protein EIP91_011586 [Steccherinum ochraceum]